MTDADGMAQFEAPTLAELSRKIFERPLWQIRDKLPLQVDPDTFEKARIEMSDVQARQGRAVATAAWVKQENFLLRGIPVVKSQ